MTPLEVALEVLRDLVDVHLAMIAVMIDSALGALVLSLLEVLWLEP